MVFGPFKILTKKFGSATILKFILNICKEIAKPNFEPRREEICKKRTISFSVFSLIYFLLA